MKRIITIYIILIFTITAQARHLNSNPVAGSDVKNKKVIEYVSLGNDFANITMEMFANGKFYIFIEPKDGKSLKLKGHWEKQDNFYILKFKKSPMPVNSLFNMNDPNRFEMLDEMQIKISSHLSSLWIWGIQCKKSDEATLIASGK